MDKETKIDLAVALVMCVIDLAAGMFCIIY